MTLRQKQSEFARLVGTLIAEAYARGFELTFGECYRSKEEAARLAKLGIGIKNSLHTQRLAIDLHLFKDGHYCPTTAAHEPLGLWWEAQSQPPEIECCWGGRFADGGHYSISHGGRK